MHEGRARLIGTARLVIAALALVLLGAVVWGRMGVLAGALLFLAVVVFAGLVLVHSGVEQAKERALSALRFHVRGLARLEHAWDELPAANGAGSTPDHPFASDLDVFGHASLMKLTDTTETRLGEVRLAALLSLESPGEWPDEWLARQQAVRELVARIEFREALATAAGVLADEKPDPAPLLAWAESADGVSGALGWAGWLLPALVAAAGAYRLVMGVRGAWWTWVALGVMGAGIAIGSRLTPFLEAASARQSAATRWREMVAAIEGQVFEAPLLVGLRERLIAGGRRASDEMAALARIVGFVDARRNDVFRLFIGPLLMWDVHWAFALLRWRARAGRHVRGWLEAIGEMEALAGLAAFAFDHPEFAWPEASPEPMFEARGLGHPLVADERRVGNDVRLSSSGTALVVTGSNMSGKSTLLRAIGVNAVLAYAGAPVCASALRIGAARVATSMRIEDSLEQGVSHFYAELRRLKRVLDLARSPGAPVLFLLDEILHGTNSRERVIGACSVVRELLARGAYGAVSTHDLGITALGGELGGCVENVHFEEQVVGEAMTFDYLLRPGIVQSSNALRLMRAVGIDVADDERQREPTIGHG